MHPRGTLNSQKFHMWPSFLPPHQWGHNPLNKFQFVCTHLIIGQSSATLSGPAPSLSQIIYHCRHGQRANLRFWKSHLIKLQQSNLSIFHSTAKLVLHSQVHDVTYILINVLCDHHLLQSYLHCRERLETTFSRIPFSICSKLEVASERALLDIWEAERSQYPLKTVASK